MSMRKKTLIVVTLLILTAITLLATLALLPPTPGPTYANFSRLENGMTQVQIERLLGKAEEKVPVLGVDHVFVALDIRDDENVPVDRLTWQTSDGDLVIVGLDKEGQMIYAAWNGAPDERSSVAKFRDRLPWIAKKPAVGRINLNSVTR